MENQNLEQFLEKDYKELEGSFLKHTSAYLVENRLEIVEHFTKDLNNFFSTIASLQSENGIAVGGIQISLLRSSIYLEKPQISFEAYDKYGMFGTKLVEQHIDIPWLFTYWADYKAKLTEYMNEKHLNRYVSEERLRVLMSEAVILLVYCFVGFIKYPLSNCDRLPSFKEISKEEGFSISAGEYFDWQKTVYIEAVPADIFFNTNKVSLQYQRYTQVVYKNKQFHHLDLSRTRFRDCHFVGCTFWEVILNDCDFIGCRFQNVEIKDSKLYGAAFEKCLIQKTEFKETDWCGNRFTGEAVTDIFREGIFLDCTLNTVSFIDSNLVQLMVSNTDLKEVTIINCETDDSAIQPEEVEI